MSLDTLVKFGPDLNVDEPPPSSPDGDVAGCWIGAPRKITTETGKFGHVELDCARPCTSVSFIGDNAGEDPDFG